MNDFNKDEIVKRVQKVLRSGFTHFTLLERFHCINQMRAEIKSLESLINRLTDEY
jgi:hypothetical protein